MFDEGSCELKNEAVLREIKVSCLMVYFICLWFTDWLVWWCISYVCDWLIGSMVYFICLWLIDRSVDLLIDHLISWVQSCVSCYHLAVFYRPGALHCLLCGCGRFSHCFCRMQITCNELHGLLISYSLFCKHLLRKVEAVFFIKGL